MNKKNIAIVLEMIPIVSAILLFVLILADLSISSTGVFASVCTVLAFLGFVFFIIGRVLAKEEKIVRILGIFDLLATASIIGLYVIVFIAIAGL